MSDPSVIASTPRTELYRFSLDVLGSDSVPEWVHLIPSPDAEGSVNARDGRTFRVDDVQAVISASNLPLLMDYEHDSEIGGSTKAAGWIIALEARSSGLWGRIDWSEQGKADIAAKHYRYLSPVILTDKKSGNVRALVGAGLTNRPALSLTAITAFREKFAHRLTEEKTMTVETQDQATQPDELVSLRETFAAQSVELGTLKELCSTLQSQLSAVQAEKQALEARIENETKERFAAQVASILDEAQRSGQILPAVREKWLAFCATPAQLETFTTLILPSLPKSNLAESPELPAKATLDDAVVLSSMAPADVAALRKMGFSDERIAAGERTRLEHAAKQQSAMDMYRSIRTNTETK